MPLSLFTRAEAHCSFAHKSQRIAHTYARAYENVDVEIGKVELAGFHIDIFMTRARMYVRCASHCVRNFSAPQYVLIKKVAYF